MKKTLKTALVLATITSAFSLSSQALAKTEGSYVGLAIIKSETKNNIRRNSVDFGYPEIQHVSEGFGINYQYALNMQDFFVSPEIFYDYLGNKASPGVDSTEVKSRHGVKVNLGYDATDNVALYVTAGLARTAYEIKYQNVGTLADNKTSPVYGFGLNFYPNKNIAINFEYNIQKLDKLKTPLSDYGYAANTKMNVIKLGASYHF